MGASWKRLQYTQAWLRVIERTVPRGAKPVPDSSRFPDCNRFLWTRLLRYLTVARASRAVTGNLIDRLGAREQQAKGFNDTRHEFVLIPDGWRLKRIERKILPHRPIWILVGLIFLESLRDQSSSHLVQYRIAAGTHRPEAPGGKRTGHSAASSNGLHQANAER